MKSALKAIAMMVALAAAGMAHSQDIRIANIVELSGPGTTAGTMFKNGVELATIIRERYPGLPVVLTSGYSSVLAENAQDAQRPAEVPPEIL